MTHLIVLVHGFIGSPRSLHPLRDAIQKAASESGERVVAHVSVANYGYFHSFLTTTDGVAAGGARLADEIRDVVKQNGTLKRLSLVGISLGGIYCRIAAKLLADFDARTICGLEPHVYISLASPHVGVGHSLRAFDANAIYVLWKIGVEQTGSQLLGFDDYAALQTLCEDEFVRAWGLFGQRVLFANLVNDNRVDFCSAALLRAPRAELHDATAKSDHSEIVAEYDVADLSPPHDDAPVLPVAERLTETQQAMLEKLRSLRFVNVDCHLDQHFVSPVVAHSSLAGTWAALAGLQGKRSMQRVVDLLLSK